MPIHLMRSLVPCVSIHRTPCICSRSTSLDRSACILVLEVLLLFGGMVLAVSRIGVHIKTHIAGGTGVRGTLGKTGLGVNDRVATLGSLDKLWVLLFQELEVLLLIPDPDAVGCKDQIHLLKCALVRLRIEAVHHGQCDDVSSTEDVVGLFAESLEDVWEHHGEPAIAQRPPDHTPCITLGTNCFKMLSAYRMKKVGRWHKTNLQEGKFLQDKAMGLSAR